MYAPDGFIIETSISVAGSHTLKAEIFKDDVLLATSNEITIALEVPEAGTPVPDVPLEQLVISLYTDDDHDELEFVGGFHDSETLANITDTDISDAMFSISGDRAVYAATVSYDSASNHLMFRHAFEGAYEGALPETGILSFTYNDEGFQFTLAFEDARE